MPTQKSMELDPACLPKLVTNEMPLLDVLDDVMTASSKQLRLAIDEIEG